jgi:hypothetical protein
MVVTLEDAGHGGGAGPGLRVHVAIPTLAG